MNAGDVVQLDDGSEAKIARVWNDKRAVANYQGLYVMLDRRDDGLWELSGEPARGEEATVLEGLLEPTLDRTVTTVTKDEP